MVFRRDGFTLVEQIVSLAILLVVGAAVTPYLVGRVDRARVDKAAASLSGMVDAATQFNRDVRPHNSILPYPGTISQLAAPITTTDLDICGTAYTASHVTAWKGPYLNRVVPPGGVPVAIGTAQDTLLRLVSGDTTLLAIPVTGVTIEDAQALNRRVDNDDATGAPEARGSVRWTPAAGDADGRVTLHYIRPVPIC